MKILFAGCSNLVDDNQNPSKESIWKSLAFSDEVEIKNISWWGVGNSFIRANTIDYLEDNNVDFVYLQFSGLCRHDFAVSKDFTTGATDNTTFVKGYKRKFMCSGGKEGTWLQNHRTKTIFMPSYFDKINHDHLIIESLQNVNALLDYLETRNIKHKWNFYYDITNPATPEVEFYDGKIEKFPPILRKKNWLGSDPHTFCHRNNGLQDDGCHFKNIVYKKWVESIKF